jgi:hypothetical protein
MEDCPNCQSTKQILQNWVDQQGHERCWYYPDLFRQLIAIFRVKASLPPKLPPRSEFEAGCRRYQMEEYETPSPPRK